LNVQADRGNALALWAGKALEICIRFDLKCLELRRIAVLFGVTASRVSQLLRQAAARVRSRLADA
jgi:predicted XRE-type DNA-binding protein